MLNILSGSVSPLTPAAEMYLRGEPLTVGDLTLGYEEYSPREAQVLPMAMACPAGPSLLESQVAVAAAQLPVSGGAL